MADHDETLKRGIPPRFFIALSTGCPVSESPVHVMNKGTLGSSAGQACGLLMG